MNNFFYDPYDEDEDEENTIGENFDEKLEYTKYLNVIDTYSVLIRFIKSNLIEINKYYEKTNKNKDKYYLEKALAIALD